MVIFGSLYTTFLKTYDYFVTYPASGRAGELHFGLSSLGTGSNYLDSLLSSSTTSFESCGFKKFETYGTFLSESCDVFDVKSASFCVYQLVI